MEIDTSSLFFNILINSLDGNVECAINKLTDDAKLGDWLTQEIIELQSVVLLRTELAETSKNLRFLLLNFVIWLRKTTVFQYGPRACNRTE